MDPAKGVVDVVDEDTRPREAQSGSSFRRNAMKKGSGVRAEASIRREAEGHYETRPRVVAEVVD